MGEFSKRIGEIGEDIVADFLTLIGWSNPQKNFDIPSINPEKHEKKSHGIDGYFHYRSPMISNTLENIIISSKFSKDPYPNNPITKFKDYYWDISIAIESFKRSEIRNTTNNQHNKVETVFDRGIIFWLTNEVDQNSDLISKLLKIETPKEVIHDGIYLVDNKRIEFIFDSILFAKNKFPGKTVEFVYFNTGLNNDDTQIKNGSILPVQYINASILPLRVAITNNDIALIITTTEDFHQDELVKLMGLAKNIGANMQSSTLICFPDYNKLKHEQTVDNTKQIFDDPSFTAGMMVFNYNSNIRG